MGVLNTMTWHLINLIHKQGTEQFGIGTRYGLDSPGIESQWGQDFLHPSRQALGPSQPPTQ